jgi:hypothetical protein
MLVCSVACILERGFRRVVSDRVCFRPTAEAALTIATDSEEEEGEEEEEEEDPRRAAAAFAHQTIARFCGLLAGVQEIGGLTAGVVCGTVLLWVRF